MDIQFVPGQRWVSNTESELGLRIVVDTANRRVTVSFPAVGERRTYAINNAPLSRVHYTVGEKVSNADGLKFTISEVIEQGGYLIYQGQEMDRPFRSKQPSLVPPRPSPRARACLMPRAMLLRDDKQP